MGWLNALYETYNYAEKAGMTDVTQNDTPLFLVAHTTQNAEIEIIITDKAEFVSAKVIEDKKDRVTVIPCTEKSATRSGKYPVAHPLFDKLQYLAGDYTEYGGEKGDSFHEDYMKQLTNWCSSEFSNKYIKAVRNYLLKGTLIKDLVEYGIIWLDEYNRMLVKWNGIDNEKPPIFKAVVGNQSDAFARIVCLDTELDKTVIMYRDREIQNDFINYYMTNKVGSELCYVTGQVVSCADNHPGKIRNTADKAKLISANDNSGFTYLGRFTEPTQVVNVSYEVSQKAHNALKWLIRKQGKFIGDKVFLTFGINELNSLNVLGEYDWDDLQDDDFSTEKIIADIIGRKLKGIKAELPDTTDDSIKYVIMILDAATPGRMSITYYKEFNDWQTDYLYSNLTSWQKRLEWKFVVYGKNKSHFNVYGAPSLSDIAIYTFGIERGDKVELNDKVTVQTIQRLIPCVVDAVAIPYDIVRAIVNRAQHPLHYSKGYNWDKVRRIACSLTKVYRKEKYREDWNYMGNCDSNDITYNCGRLLAVMDYIELQTYNDEERKSRVTNVKQYFAKFAQNPCKSIGIISEKLVVYENKLKSLDFRKYVICMQYRQEISSKIDPEQFKLERNLDGRMLIGYDAQMNMFYSKNEKEN